MRAVGQAYITCEEAYPWETRAGREIVSHRCCLVDSWRSKAKTQWPADLLEELDTLGRGIDREAKRLDNLDTLCRFSVPRMSP